MTFEGSWKQRSKLNDKKGKQNAAEEANKLALALLFSCFLSVNTHVAGLKVEISIKVPAIFAY